MKPFRKLFNSRGAVIAALIAVGIESGWLVTDCFLHPAGGLRPLDEDPYKVPVVTPKANHESAEAKNWEADAPKADTGEYWDWLDKRMDDALARQKTVAVPVETDEIRFPDDDSLTAYFWRRSLRAEGLFSDADTQFQMNVCSDQQDISLQWMLKAMLAELHLIYEDDTRLIAVLDASQKAWEDYAAKQQVLRYPYPDNDYGSSTAMVFHGASVPVTRSRIDELVPWLMGVDSSGGSWIGLGSLSYDDVIAYRKAELRAEGRWPLVPANIGIDPKYGDDYLTEFEEAEAARHYEEPKSEPETVPESQPQPESTQIQ